MRARLRSGLGALRLAFVVVSHVRSSKSRLDIANQGVKSYQAAETGGRASSDRAVAVDHDSAAAKKLGPQRCQGPTRFLRRAPFLMTAWMLSTVKTVMQLRKQNLVLRGQAKCH
jgi:hypothetical protein